MRKISEMYFKRIREDLSHLVAVGAQGLKHKINVGTPEEGQGGLLSG